MSVYKKPEKPRYLYYGSSERLDAILPSQAWHSGDKTGSRMAVYAASVRDIVLAYALGAVPDENGQLDRVMSHKYGGEVKMIFLKGRPNFGGQGYVYKLPVKGFVFNGATQWVSFSPVKPLETDEINVDDYLHMFRYATAEEKLQIEENFSER